MGRSGEAKKTHKKYMGWCHRVGYVNGIGIGVKVRENKSAREYWGHKPYGILPEADKNDSSERQATDEQEEDEPEHDDG